MAFHINVRQGSVVSCSLRLTGVHLHQEPSGLSLLLSSDDRETTFLVRLPEDMIEERFTSISLSPGLLVDESFSPFVDVRSSIPLNESQETIIFTSVEAALTVSISTPGVEKECKSKGIKYASFNSANMVRQSAPPPIRQASESRRSKSPFPFIMPSLDTPVTPPRRYLGGNHAQDACPGAPRIARSIHVFT